MKQQTIALQQVLPIYIAIELSAIALAVSVILWFVPSWSVVLTHGEGIKNSLTSSLFAKKVKTINVMYYGKEYTINTIADNLAQFAELNPFIYRQGTQDELRRVLFVDGGKVILPLSQYQTGTASWYGSYFQGRPTASTEPYDMHALTAAHKELPLGTMVRVTNVDNMKDIVVRINDRGPYIDDRVIDMSYEAARQLEYVGEGITDVVIEIIKESPTAL